MRLFAEIIGWVFILFFIIGATVPGMHFHAVFGSDEVAKKFHEKHVKELSDGH